MSRISPAQCATFFNALNDTFVRPCPELPDLMAPESRAVLAPVHTHAISETEAAHIDFMRATPAHAGTSGMHIGIGGLVNLGYAAQYPDGLALFTDRNHGQTVFWRHIIDTLNTTTSPTAFYREGVEAALVQTRKDIDTALNARELYPARDMEGIMADHRNPMRIARGGVEKMLDMLQCHPKIYGLAERDFENLQGMTRQGRLGALTLSLTDTDGFEALSNCFRAAKVTPTQFYTSNVLCTFFNDESCFYDGMLYDPDATQDRALANIRRVTNHDEATPFHGTVKPGFDLFRRKMPAPL